VFVEQVLQVVDEMEVRVQDQALQVAEQELVTAE
jgi:hypothetical protein